MVMKHLSPRERAIAFATGGLFLLAVSYRFIMEPIARNYGSFDDQIRAKESSIVKQKSLLAAYEGLLKEHARIAPQAKTGQSEEEERAQVLSDIERISEASACFIANIKPRESRQMGSYSEIMFEVIAEGSMAELSRFFYELETSNNLIRIKHFTIASQALPGSRLKCSLIIGKVIIQ